MGIDAEPGPDATSRPASPGASPDLVRSFRWQLTPGGDLIDTATWAGSVPQVNGIAPRVRVGGSRWFNLLWLVPIGFLLLIVAVAIAKGLRGEPSTSPAVLDSALDAGQDHEFFGYRQSI
jgi:methionine sulfoxide reductase catalytic subunit